MKGAGRRVAITGYGVVAPCGIGRKAFWDGLNGPGITDHRSIEIADWDPLPYFANPKEARRADRVEQFAVAAAAEAFEHAGRPAVEPDRFGTIFATGVGGLRSTEEQIERPAHQGRAPCVAVPGADDDAQRGRCGHLDALRPARSERDDHNGVRGIDTRNRVRSTTDRVGHVRRSGHRWCRVCRVPGRGHQLRQHDGALDDGLESPVRRRPRRFRARRGRSRADARGVVCSRASGCQHRRRDCWGRRATPTPTTSLRLRREAPAQSPACDWRSTTPASSPATSGTSTPTARRPRSTMPQRPLL